MPLITPKLVTVNFMLLKLGNSIAPSKLKLLKNITYHVVYLVSWPWKFEPLSFLASKTWELGPLETKIFQVFPGPQLLLAFHGNFFKFPTVYLYICVLVLFLIEYMHPLHLEEYNHLDLPFLKFSSEFIHYKQHSWLDTFGGKF